MTFISDWTDPRVSRMLELHGEKKSSAVIAKIINDETGSTFSRNSVIGKLHRSGLRGHKPAAIAKRRSRQPRGFHIRPNWHNGPSLKAEPIPPPITFTDEHKCTLFELNNNSCRFPLWDGDMPFASQFYCGCPEADIEDRKPYCHFHSAVAYRPVPVREAAE